MPDNEVAAIKARPIVYLEHPVTPEEKAKHIAAGKRIMDIRFSPDYKPGKPKADAPAPVVEPEKAETAKTSKAAKAK